MLKICLVVLIGLPGAGKTTFCQNYQKYVKMYNIIHICYDKIIKFDANDKQKLYKENRRNILEKIKILIRNLKSLNSNLSVDSTNWFNIKLNKNCEYYIILIDDNNYYVGMRYEFYKICRESEISFAQLYFPIDVIIAVNRNLSRINNRVPEYIIQRMNKRIQKPNFKWEENTLYLEGDKTDEYANINLFLERSFESPLKLPTAFKNVSIEQSLVHKIDLLLRKEIKTILETKKHEENFNSLPNILNELRKSILNDLRNGILQTDINDCEKIIQLLSI